MLSVSSLCNPIPLLVNVYVPIYADCMHLLSITLVEFKS